MEVCQYFGYYLPGSAINSQMTLSQRTVNMLYALRDYSPLMTSLALVLLPIALLPRHPDRFAVTSSEYCSHLFWLKLSFMTVFLSHKINRLIMYKDIGLSRVTNFQSQEVWLAPCKPISFVRSSGIPEFCKSHSIRQPKRDGLI